jgi:methylglutaconyl-CoA hydratase
MPAMGSQTAEGLTIEVEDGVVTATIDRGDDKNLLTMAACRALIDLLDAPPPDAHVLRLRARGPVFCLGREREADEPGALRGEAETLVGLNRALERSTLVSLAEVNGDAAGFGVGLAALADVAIADPGARFWFPEVRIDLAPAVVLAWLPRVVGRKQAFWMTATGEAVSAARAVELGLVTAVAEEGAVAEAADAAVALLRAQTPRVHTGIKSLLGTMGGMDRDAADAYATERLIIGSMSRSRGGEHD